MLTTRAWLALISLICLHLQGLDVEPLPPPEPAGVLLPIAPPTPHPPPG